MGGGVVVKQWTRIRPEDRQWTGQRANWRLSHKPVLWFHFSEWYFGWSRDTYILLLCHRTLVRLSRPSAIHLGAFQVFAPLLLRVISRSGCSTCPTAFFTAAHMLYPSSSFCPRFPSLESPHQHSMHSMSLTSSMNTFRPYQPTGISCLPSLIKLIFYASHLAHNYTFPNFAS